MKPRRILLFAPLPPPLHGQALMAGVLAGESKSWSGLELDAMDAKFADSLADLKAFSLSKVMRLFRYACRISWYCLTKRPDAVVLTPGFYRNTFLKDSIFIWLTAFILRRKVIAWFHMDYGAFAESPQPGWFRKYMKLTLRRCARFVVCTDKLKATAPDFLPPDRIVALQNGIPDPAEGKTATPGFRDSLTVLYVSNMMETKGWKILLEAAAALCRERKDVQFVFYGAPTGEISEVDIREAFLKAGPPSRIRYEGFLDAQTKPDVFRRADLFCMPTFTEAFPIAVLEALAFGLPVIASRVGGIPDMVEEGNGAWLVEPRSVLALHAALTEALLDRSKLASSGIAARARFDEKFTAAGFAARWEQYLTGAAMAA